MASRSPVLAADRAAERGFSLIEVLIALTLFAILMAMLSSGVRLGSRIQASGSEQIDEWSQIAAVQRFLRAELATTQLARPARRLPCSRCRSRLPAWRSRHGRGCSSRRASRSPSGSSIGSPHGRRRTRR